MAKNKKKGYVLDAVKMSKLSGIFKELVERLIVLSGDAESVCTICREFLSDARSSLRCRDGFIYAAREMGTEIDMKIKAHAARRRESALAGRLAEMARQTAEKQAWSEFRLMPQMLIADGRSRRSVGFPIVKRNPELETGEALQSHDLIYIIGINETSKNGNKRLFDTDISTLKKRSARVLDEIAEKYRGEIDLVRIDGPRINGKEGYIYHGNVLCLVTRYMEEQALQKLLYPPCGNRRRDVAEAIVEAWNAMKRGIAEDAAFMSTKGGCLKRLGILDCELVYTPEGLWRRPVRCPENITEQRVVPYGGVEM